MLRPRATEPISNRLEKQLSSRTSRHGAHRETMRATSMQSAGRGVGIINPTCAAGFSYQPCGYRTDWRRGKRSEPDILITFHK